MKIVTPQQMRAIESSCYRNGFSEEDFMEEAGKGVAKWVDSFVTKENLNRFVYLLCGKGNNAGDLYVAGSYLLEKGYKALAYQVIPLQNCSPLCQKNSKHFCSKGGQIKELNDPDVDLTFPEPAVIVDALFGTGFRGIAKEPFATVIKKANQAKRPILAVDIPSGLNGDTGSVEGAAINAQETIFLGLPKLGFFLQDGWNHVGILRFVDFGLPKSAIEEADFEFAMLTPSLIAELLPPLVRNRHKYQAGYVVGLAGSPGMPGAALLSSKGALRTGAGMVKLLHKEGMQAELAASQNELIKVSYQENDYEKIVELMNQATATFIGPGLGRDKNAVKLLKTVLPLLKKPKVIDADALTIIAEENLTIPTETILTPHVGEMIRLLKHSVPKPGTKEFLDTCQDFVEKTGVTLVLKGGPTFIFHPLEKTHVNPFGGPGMATAGSGDVLTGMIAALLAQGVKGFKAAELGVSLHGIAGDLAAKRKTPYCMIASDILESLPEAFSSLRTCLHISSG